MKYRIHEMICLGLLDEDATQKGVKEYLKLQKEYPKDKGKKQSSLSKKDKEKKDKK